MILKEHELLQIDDNFIYRLLEQNPDALAGLSIKLVNDLKEARERLNQNSSNSSRPSSSLAPWEKGVADNLDQEEDELLADEIERLQSEPDNNQEAPDLEDASEAENLLPTEEKKHRKPGRQTGSPGFGRTQKFEVTDTVHHFCHCCLACQENLTAVEKAYTGFQTINIQFGSTESPGIQVTTTQHLYYTGLCPQCGLENRSEPWRAPAPADTGDWKKTGMTEWRLIGPDLAALIVYLAMEIRIPRRKIKLLLWDMLGIEVSIGTLQNTLIESARALEPVESQLIADLCRESLIYADETSHPEAGNRLWLWVFTSLSTALFWVGHRTKEIFTTLFDTPTDFNGHLMTDGYSLYRVYQKRLRCWAHLLRKAKGLRDSYTKMSKRYGQQVLTLLNELIEAVYQARTGPDGGMVSILAQHQATVDQLKQVCESMAVSSHQKTAELGREFLNDWAAIFHVLDFPAWPLTNNEAERALRHWVLLRKISQGTRTEQGSRALALFASVFLTCRLRNCSPILYLRQVIAYRRQGMDVPQLPPRTHLAIA